MVRFSSNLSKKTKGGRRQNTPLLSKEAPVVFGVKNLKTTHLSTSNATINTQPSHLHSHSLPSNTFGHVPVYSNEQGLSSSQAIKASLEEMDLALKKYPHDISILKHGLFSIRNLSLSSLLLFQIRNVSLVLFISAMIAFEVVLINYFAAKRSKNAASEAIQAIRRRLKGIIKALLSNKLDLDELYNVNIKVPMSPAINYVRVMRDEAMRMVSMTWLVSGDLVVLLPGESIPICGRPVTLTSSVRRKFKNVPLDASFMVIEEIPLQQVLEHQLSPKSSTKLLFSMIHDKFLLLFNQILLLAVAVTWKNPNLQMSLIPLVIISSPILKFIWWLVSNCYISLLLEQIITSDTPFKEIPNTDEFDEDAPPPVKNIKIPFWKIFSELFNGKRRVLRFWEDHMIEALGLTSVFCFLDREGPISSPFIRPCELIIPSINEAEIVAVELIPSVSDPHRVHPSLKGLPGMKAENLRAIGLALLLSADCESPVAAGHCRHRNVLTDLLRSIPEHMQTCYCAVAKEVGFDETILARFRRIKTIWRGASHHTHHNNHSHGKHVKKHHSSHASKGGNTISILLEDLRESSVRYSMDQCPIGHLFTFGETSDILGLCSHAFAVGATMMSLSDSLTRKLKDFEATMRSCDIYCVAFAYRPIFPDERDAYLGHSLQHQILLGVLAVCPEPKPDFQEFIDDLEAAGIRFAYFSPFRERQSKAFGERLGLETDWNSCILLSENSNPDNPSSGYSSLSDIKARLPRGVNAIRPHLDAVDDIPLHVSIFAECDAESSAEMIKIYQESGEVVSVLGSCRSLKNSVCFAAGNFAIGSDVFAGDGHKNSSFESFDDLALEINGNSVKFLLPAYSSPYVLTELIRESRTLLQNSLCAWEYLIGSLGSLTLCLWITGSALISVFWICLIVILLAVTIVLGPYDPQVMKSHPTILNASKCPQEVTVSLTFSLLSISALRFLPGSFILMGAAWFYHGQLQLFELFACIMLSMQVLPCLHAVNPLKLRSIHHVFAGGESYYLAIWGLGLSLLSSIIRGYFQESFAGVTLCCLLASVGGAILIINHEVIKFFHLRDKYDQAQKRAKLLFNTKLGMHSPV